MTILFHSPWENLLTLCCCKIAEDVTPPAAVLKVLTLMSRVTPKAKLFPQKDMAKLAFRDLKKRKMVWSSYSLIRVILHVRKSNGEDFGAKCNMVWQIVELLGMIFCSYFISFTHTWIAMTHYKHFHAYQSYSVETVQSNAWFYLFRQLTTSYVTMAKHGWKPQWNFLRQLATSKGKWRRSEFHPFLPYNYPYTQISFTVYEWITFSRSHCRFRLHC